jgi:2-C-methyl-D-erythritol 2,4-cyclodiphosphate synthase
MRYRIGQGIDVHPFAGDRPLVLGGIAISPSGGLDGHSDADAVLHAVTDAILGAAGEGDIGDYFPSTDERWRGAASSLFVEEAMGALERKGGSVENIDITIVAQTPKLAPHRASMRESVAALIRVSIDEVSIKATTTDHLGFIGRKEGVCVVAVVLCRFE